MTVHKPATLTEQLRLHQLYLEDPKKGKRAFIYDGTIIDRSLEGVNLSYADLGHAMLEGLSLKGANLSGASLYSARLQRSDLRDANLAGACMAWARLQKADLRGANLKGTTLFRVRMGGSKIDPVYKGLQLTAKQVAETILARKERFSPFKIHADKDWITDDGLAAKPIDDCETKHNIDGWVQHLAALERPELVAPEINPELLTRQVMGARFANYELIDWGEEFRRLEILLKNQTAKENHASPHL